MLKVQLLRSRIGGNQSREQELGQTVPGEHRSAGSGRAGQGAPSAMARPARRSGTPPQHAAPPYPAHSTVARHDWALAPAVKPAGTSSSGTDAGFPAGSGAMLSPPLSPSLLLLREAGRDPFSLDAPAGAGSFPSPIVHRRAASAARLLGASVTGFNP